MKDNHITPEMVALVPDLADWGDTEISIADWVGYNGNFQLAIGYSHVFWPKIVKFGEYVLVEQSADQDLIAVWENASGGNKRDVEAMLNHIHMIDINGGNPSAEHNEAQLIELGHTLRDIYTAKLAWLFPDMSFEVVFEGEPGGDPADFQVTFWTKRDHE